jgi:zinc D-Ala-D-Ala carboxypeptidase
MPSTKLSEHFTLEEFTASQTAARKGIDNTPSPEIVAQLRNTSAMLEKVRALLGGVPVIISSGYRSPALNALVGGAKSSAHMTGRAADILVPAFGTPIEVCDALCWRLEELGVDQLIYEFNSWTHIATSEQPRHEVLTIDQFGTRARSPFLGR